MGPRQSIRLRLRLLLPVAIAALGCFEKTGPVLGPPSNVPLPDAVAPVPSPAQVAWQTREVAAFPQACLKVDRLSAYEGMGLTLGEALESEFSRGSAVVEEARKGAARFAEGAGRHGRF